LVLKKDKEHGVKIVRGKPLLYAGKSNKYLGISSLSPTDMYMEWLFDHFFQIKLEYLEILVSLGNLNIGELSYISSLNNSNIA